MAQSVSAQLDNLDKRIQQLNSDLDVTIQKAQQWNQALSQGVTNNNIAQLKRDFDDLSKAYTRSMDSYQKSLGKVERIEQSLSQSRRNDNKILERQNRLLQQRAQLTGAGGAQERFSTLSNLLPTSVDWSSILKTTNAQSGQDINNIAAGAKSLTKEERERLRIQKEQEKELKKQEAEYQKMANAASRIGGALVSFFALDKIKDFVSQMVKVRGEFEMQQVALQNMLGNKEKADEIWDKTLQLALQSPLTAMQLTKYTKQLAAFRVETSKLYDTTKMLADVSVGLGVDMQRLIYAYGHTKSSGFLRGMYARQFATAGVNIYGELAEYYSEVEKKAVSVREVYDRISKKMVTYADVEQVFKKLTSEGGTFFNMQKEMSDTVAGQINKVKDAYQQMLNTIGKGQQGAIRTVVDLLLQLIKNWQTFGGILVSAGIGVAVGKLTQLTVALRGVEVAGIKASGSVIKLSTSIKGLATALQRNWITLLITLVASLATETIMANKKMKDYNESIWEGASKLNQTRRKLAEYQATLEQNNETLKDATKSQEEKNAASIESKKILDKLKKDYPELVEGMTQEANGYVNLTNGVKSYCEELERQIKLQALAQQKQMFNDPFSKDMEEQARNLMNYQREFYNTQLKAEMLSTKLVEAGEKDSPLNKILEQVIALEGVDIERDMNKLQQYMEEAYKIVYAYNERTHTYEPNSPWAGEVFDIVTRARTRPGGVQKHRKEAYKEMDAYTALFEKWTAQNILEIEEYHKEISDTSTAGVMAWLAENAKRVDDDIKAGKYDPLKTVRDFLEKNASGETEEMRIFLNRVLNDKLIKPFTKISKDDWQKALQSRWGVLKSRDFLVDWFTRPESNDSNNPEGSENKGVGTKKSISTLVELLKKMNSEYVKLKENAYGAAKSQEKVMEGYKDAFDEIFGTGGNALVDWNKVDITSKAGVVAAIDELIANLDKGKSGGWGKYQKDAKKQVKKLQAELKTEIGVEIEVVKREEFEKKMDNLFKDYELTVELKGLNISQDAAQAMFDFEYQSLWDLQKAMDEFYAEQKKNEQGDLLDEKAWDSYKKYAEKIEGEIYKERKERAKKYSEFLKQELSARATLTKEYYENLAMVAAESSFTEKERENIITGLTDAYKKALQKLDWEDFKSSDFYVEMMEDLTEMPVKYMEIMLKEVNNIIEKADVLSPRALKEALRARREVQEAILSEASFKGIFEQTIGAFRAYRKSSERGEGDEFNKRAEELYGKGETIATSGLVRERKLLRESINLRAEELANIEKTIDAYDDQNGRLKAYYDALEKLNQLRASGANFEGFGVSKAGLDMLDSLINDNKNILAYKDSETSPLLSTLSGEEKDRKVKELEQEITRWQGIRKAIDEALIAQQAYNKAKENLAAEDYLGGVKGEGGVVSLSENVSSRNKLKVRRDTLTKAQMGDKEALKDLKRFEKAWQEFSNTVNNTKDKVKSLGSATYDMLEALGAETNVVTEAWKNFGDTLMDTIIGALTMIPQLVVGFVSAGTAINAAMGIIGLIAEAIQLVIVLVTSLAQLHDAQIKKDLDDSKKRVDALSKAYDKLKESIDATITAAEYFINYSETISNINEQIQEANFRLQEAQGLKKKADREEAIAEAEDALEDLRKKLREAEADLQDTFGGIARDDFRSWAEDFVSAWTDAFKETGDGYDALMETFEEKMMDTFKKQALMRGLAKIMEPVENAINSFVGDDGVLDEAELADIRERMRVAADNGDAYMRQMAELFDLSAEGSLSGLTAGIQGMTEEQADVLTGYWNSVRLYAAEIDLHVGMIADAFNNPESTNPMLNQIRLIARNTESINSLLGSVSKGGHTLGGTGIKVFVQ